MVPSNDAEQVAVRILEHDEVVVGPIAPWIEPGSDGNQALDFGLSLVRVQIEVQPAPLPGAPLFAPGRARRSAPCAAGRQARPSRPSPVPWEHSEGPAARRCHLLDSKHRMTIEPIFMHGDDRDMAQIAQRRQRRGAQTAATARPRPGMRHQAGHFASVTSCARCRSFSVAPSRRRCARLRGRASARDGRDGRAAARRRLGGTLG